MPAESGFKAAVGQPEAELARLQTALEDLLSKKHRSYCDIFNYS